MRLVTGVLALIVCLAVLFGLTELYEWWRRRINKPRIGQMGLLSRYLKRGNYVCIDGRLLRFSHIAQRGEAFISTNPPRNENLSLGGELAFTDPDKGIYVYYEPSAMSNCKYIYGKYGVKWAADLRSAYDASAMMAIWQ